MWQSSLAYHYAPLLFSFLLGWTLFLVVMLLSGARRRRSSSHRVSASKVEEVHARVLPMGLFSFGVIFLLLMVIPILRVSGVEGRWVSGSIVGSVFVLVIYATYRGDLAWTRTYHQEPGKKSNRGRG